MRCLALLISLFGNGLEIKLLVLGFWAGAGFCIGLSTIFTSKVLSHIVVVF
jgi:hypothetical protein